jgi:hypothetical protein
MQCMRKSVSLRATWNFTLPVNLKLQQEVLGRTNLPTFPMVMIATVTLAKHCMWCNHNNPRIKQSQPNAVQGWKIMPPTNNVEPQPFKKGWRYGIKNYCIEVPLNGITSIPNFMKIYLAVQKLLVGDTQTHTYRQTGDLTSLLSFFGK